MTGFRGAIIAANRMAAQIGWDRLCTMTTHAANCGPVDREWVVLTPRSINGCRGCQLPNRIIVFELEPYEIPDDLWHALLPSIRHDGHEPVNVTWIRRNKQLPLTISDHAFTVAGRGGPMPPEHPCAFVYSTRGVCGKRADMHVTVRLATG